MRILAAAALLASVLLLGASAAPAKSDYGPRTTALREVRLGVSYAMTLEANAIKLSKAGKEGESIDEVKNALHLLKQVLPAAKTLTPPGIMKPWIPPSSWEKLISRLTYVIGADEDSLRATTPLGGRYPLYHANEVKDEIYKLLDAEIRRPMCTELINLRGPITVNGVPQGPSQLSVDVSCKQPEQKVIVVVPTSTVVQAVPDGGATAVAVKAASVVEVDLNGAKSGGVTIETKPDAAAGAPVDSDVIPIAGDSHDEYFGEGM
jgi:hypothetical protein